MNSPEEVGWQGERRSIEDEDWSRNSLSESHWNSFNCGWSKVDLFGWSLTVQPSRPVQPRPRVPQNCQPANSRHKEHDQPVVVSGLAGFFFLTNSSRVGTWERNQHQNKKSMVFIASSTYIFNVEESSCCCCYC